MPFPQRCNLSAIFNFLLQGSQKGVRNKKTRFPQVFREAHHKTQCPCMRSSRFEKKLLQRKSFSLPESKWCYESKRGQSLLH